MKETVFDFSAPEYVLVMELIEKTKHSFFLTGKAGTGKSTFLRYLLDQSKKNFLVIAPTGIAAINAGGVTIHSFFEFPLRRMSPEDPSIKTFWRESEKRKIISSLDTVIIDEVSMVRADLIDAIDCSLRRNGGNPNLPFGGKQILFVGDVFQLEPIMPADVNNLSSYKQIYGNGHFYNARVFSNIAFTAVELTQPHRQSDKLFVDLLDKIRINEVSDKDLEILNERVNRQKIADEYTLTLTTRANAAEAINKTRIGELSTEAISYQAEISGTFESGKFPTDQTLVLKQGAQVIFIRNDPGKRWVNGTIGKIENLTESSIMVRLPSGAVESISRLTWEQIRYEFDEDKARGISKVIGKFVQYPLKLAWAITIHKSQGMTLDSVVIDFGSGAFAGGQAYVALSRVKKLTGLMLNQQIKHTDIIVDESLKTFIGTLPPASTDLLKDESQSIHLRDTGRIGGYYFRMAFEKIGVVEDHVVLNNLIKSFAHLTSDRDLNSRDSSAVAAFAGSNSMEKLANDSRSSQSFFMCGIILFYIGKVSEALDCLFNSKLELELIYFFVSKCYLKIGDNERALGYINKSLGLVSNSRNLYHKALVLQAINGRLDEDRKKYVECLTDAFLEDTRSSSVYADILIAVKEDDFLAQLPSLEVFKQEVDSVDPQERFFRSIVRVVNRYRKKLLNISSTPIPYSEPDTNLIADWNSNEPTLDSKIADNDEEFLLSHENDLTSDWSFD